MKDWSISKSRAGRYGRLAALSMLLMLVAGLGCDALGCGSGKVPDTASSRVEDMAGHLPQDAEFSFVVGDLEGMRTSLQTARDTIGDAVPTDLIQEQARNELGIDLFDAESWEQSGIAEDGGLTLSVVGNRPVLVTYVADQQRFEKAFTDQLQKSLGVEGAVKSETIDGQTVKVLGADDQTVAWAYDGKLVAAAFPESEELTDAAGAEDVQPAPQVAAHLVGLDSTNSLAATGSYGRFNQALAADQSMALFVNVDVALDEERIDNLKQGQEPVGQATVTWIDENVHAIALSMHVENNSLKFRGWADLPAEIKERAQEIMTPPTEGPIESFATANTLLGLRTSVDMPKLWAFYKDTLPDEQRQQLTAEFERAGSQLNLDIEQDVINKMTGNLGIVFYGIDQSVLEQTGGNIMRAAMMQPFQLLAVMVPVQFQDNASLEKVVNAVTETAGGMATRSTVQDDVDVLKMENVAQPRGQIFLQDDLLVYATDAFSDQSVYQYITDQREEGKLGDSDEFDLGQNFGGTDNYNGLYVNFERAQNQLGGALANTQPQALEFLAKFEEAALTTEVDDTGAFLDLTVDLTPQANAEGDEAADNE